MTDATVESSRIFIRYGSKSSESAPTKDDIMNIFSSHGRVIDVDRRAKFCFVEYNCHSAAQSAVEAENGREFNGGKLEVEIAVKQAPKPKVVEDNSSEMTLSGAERKSSFVTDKWLAQQKAAKITSSDQDVVSSSEDVDHLNSAGKCSATEKSAGTAPSSLGNQRCCDSSAAAVNKQSQKCEASSPPRSKSSHSGSSRHSHKRLRSRSPPRRKSPLRFCSSKYTYKSQSPSVQMQHLRQLESELEKQMKQSRALKQHSSLNPTSVELLKTSSLDAEGSAIMCVGDNPTGRQLPPQSTLQYSSGPMESYSTSGSGQNRTTSVSQYHRAPDMTSLSKNTSAQMSVAEYDCLRRGNYQELNTSSYASVGGGVQCEIFIHSTNYSEYAKDVAVQIERIGLLVRVSLLSANVDIMDEVAAAMKRGCLFALSVASCWSSVILYILHGEPEEHRNMLLEDALSTIARSFGEYYRCRQTRQSSAGYNSSVKTAVDATLSSQSTVKTTSDATPTLHTIAEHLQPDTVTRRLIGLLSADCDLTHVELEHIVCYLRFRQKAIDSGR